MVRPNFQKFHILHQKAFTRVLCGSQNKQRSFSHTALTYRYITEAVYTGPCELHIWITFRLILLSITVETRLRSQANPCEICGGQSGSGTGFSPRTAVFSVSVIPQISTLIFIYMSLLAEGQTVEGWEPSKKQYFFVYWGALDIKVRIFT